MVQKSWLGLSEEILLVQVDQPSTSSVVELRNFQEVAASEIFFSLATESHGMIKRQRIEKIATVTEIFPTSCNGYSKRHEVL